ncbi:MAG: ferritin-like domain-containing protein [Angelakisella sp.]
MEKMICKASEPYPEVTCCGQNLHDVEIIRPLYSGNASEITAIMQYVYQHVVLEKCYSEVSEVLKSIAMVEMHHMGLLADAICAMGGNPQYLNPDIRSCWNASPVCYEQNVCKVLLKNLNDETSAHHSYLAAAEKVETPSLCALLRRIAADEKLHMEIITAMINCHCRKPCEPEQERRNCGCTRSNNRGRCC